jgi:hypothetical protein
LLQIVVQNGHPDKARFDRDHVYSLSKEAVRKRDIDLRIINDDYSRSAEISITSESYLKSLINLASKGSQSVRTNAKDLQFFIVRGGAEGLFGRFGASLVKEDAGNVLAPGSTTSGQRSPDFRWDLNDLLIVFDPKGKLIRAVLLQRPISISGGIWTEKTSAAVYNAWHNKTVSIYRNTTYDVHYLGLFVNDGMKHRGWVDMHKQEATNGCIFIDDPNTPDMSDLAKINAFEPQLIHDVLAAIGKTAAQVRGAIHLGTMRLVDIK